MLNELYQSQLKGIHFPSETCTVWLMRQRCIWSWLRAAQIALAPTSSLCPIHRASVQLRFCCIA